MKTNSEELEFGRKLRHELDCGAAELDRDIAQRLHVARRVALEHQYGAVHGLSLAGFNHLFADLFFGHARAILAAVALLVGASGSYVWDKFEESAANEEVDSALLSDELPPAAYLDHGFRAWIEHSSQSSQDSQ